MNEETGWRETTWDSKGNRHTRMIPKPDFNNHICWNCKEKVPMSELIWDRPKSTASEHPYPRDSHCPHCGAHALHEDHFPP